MDQQFRRYGRNINTYFDYISPRCDLAPFLPGKTCKNVHVHHHMSIMAAKEKKKKNLIMRFEDFFFMHEQLFHIIQKTKIQKFPFRAQTWFHICWPKQKNTCYRYLHCITSANFFSIPVPTFYKNRNNPSALGLLPKAGKVLHYEHSGPKFTSVVFH